MDLPVVGLAVAALVMITVLVIQRVMGVDINDWDRRRDE